MINSIALAVANRMNLREAMIAPHYQGLQFDMQSFMEADTELEEAAAEKHRAKQLLGTFGLTPGIGVEKPFAFADGVAVIPVQGTLINRCNWSWGGWLTGYNFIRSQLLQAVADPDVELIVLDVNSYGGEAAGCFELCDDIYAARQEKPILAVVDSNCYSAGYAIASSASKVVITPSGGAGSIGVVVTHFDMSAALEKYGVKVTFIKAGDHKTDGNPYEELPQAVKDNIQANVNLSMDAFVALVVRNREMTEEAVRGTQAAIYRAQEALTLGLVDAIEAPSKAIVAYQVLMDAEAEANEKGNDDDANETPDDPDNSQEPTMKTTQTPGADTAAATTQALQEAANTARVEERARVSGIMGCEEAKGREGLANHFAMNTSMSVEDAKAALAAAPVAAAAAPKAGSEVTSTELSTGKNTAFHQAMDAANHPNVGADAGAGDASGEQAKDPAAGILAAQAKASGRALKAKA